MQSKNRLYKIFIGIFSLFFIVLCPMVAIGYGNHDLRAENMETELTNVERLEYTPNAYIPTPEEVPELTDEMKPIAEKIMRKYNVRSLLSQSNGTKIETPIQIVNPTVFIELKNDAGNYGTQWISDESLAKAEEAFNTGENSLRNYFKKISYGKLDIVTEFYPKDVNGKVTSVKSPFYKRFVLPQTNAPDFAAGGSIDPTIGYNPAVNANATTDNRSARVHEYQVLNYALKDKTATGGSTVVAQIGNDYNPDLSSDAYDNLNSRYANLHDFSEWDREFSWSGQVNGGSWPAYYKTFELLSADTFTFVIRASDSEAKNNDVLWPHNYGWGTAFPTLLGKHIATIDKNGSLGELPMLIIDRATTVYGDYDTSKPAGTKGSGFFSETPNLGVIVHETAHQFGVPDLYRTSYEGQAVGSWDLMGAQQTMSQYQLQFTNGKYGIWNTPDPISVTSTMPLSNRTDLQVDYTTYTQQDTKNVYKIIPTDYATKKEYFMVEYRKKTSSGFDSSIPNSGLLIYRVKDGITNIVPGYTDVVCGMACGNMFGPPDEVFLYRPNAANANLGGQSAIDANLNQAAFPRTINGTQITGIGKSLTDVPRDTFDANALYYSDGTNSGIQIINISDPGTTSMTFTVLYDGESLPTDPVGLSALDAAETSIDTRSGSIMDDNELTITGGKAPYTFQVNSVTKDEQTVDASLFAISDTDANDKKANLNLANGKQLIEGTYQVEIQVNDSDAATQTTTIVYHVKKAYPSDPAKVKFQAHAFSESEIDGSTILGTLSLDGCSQNGCASDYEYTSIEYQLEFLQGKDYRTYFDMHPLLGGSGIIGAKKAIPTGTYPFIATITFKESGKADVVLRSNELQITVSETPDTSSVPSISTPTGNALSSTWKKSNQPVSFTVEDTNLGLKEITISTSDGALLNEDNQEVKMITKNYNQSDAMKSSDVVIQVMRNGTYEITATNWEQKSNVTPVRFTVDKIDHEAPIWDKIALDNSKLVNATELDFALVLFANDGDPMLSGIKNYEYSWSFGNEQEHDMNWKSYMATDGKMNVKNVEHKPFLCARVFDNADNATMKCQKVNRLSDYAGPSLNIDRNPNGWTNDSVVLDVSARDQSGLTEIKITTVDGNILENGVNQTSVIRTYNVDTEQQMTSFTLTKNATYTISAKDQSEREDGPFITTETITLKQIDKEKPIIETFRVDVDGVPLKASITVVAKDKPDTVMEQSGIKDIYYQHVAKDATTNASAWLIYQDGVEWTTIDDGSICVRAEDNAGNFSDEQCKTFAGGDQEKPTIGTIQNLVDITKDPSGWINTATLTLNVHFQDADSGLARVTVSKDGNTIVSDSFTDHPSDQDFTFDVSENGSYQITLHDENGNSEHSSFVVNQFDRQAPVIDGLETTMARMFLIFPTGNQVVQVNAHDLPNGLNSGFVKYHYRFVAEGEVIPETEDSSWTALHDDENFRVSEGFKGQVYVYAYDGAGNRSAIHKEEVKAPNAPDANLKMLSVNYGTLEPSFDPDIYDYTLHVANAVDHIQFQAIANDTAAVVRGDLNQSLSLSIGDNSFVIMVENDTETKSYTINVTRDAQTSPTVKDATLKSLRIGDGSLSPAFAKDVYEYKATVEASVMSLTISAQASDTEALVHGDANKLLYLNDGDNVFTINVSNQDQSKSYRVIITRKKAEITKSSDATLKSLSISSGTLSPSFQASTLNYTTSVENNIDKVTIHAVANHTSATINGDIAKELNLNIGENTATIQVNAEDGSTNKTYKIVITRKAITDQVEIKELTNEDQSITVFGNFNESLKLVSQPMDVKSIALSDEFKNEYALKDVYDIHLEKEDGSRYELTSSVKVRLRLNDELKGQTNLIAVYIDDDGSVENMPTTIFQDYLEFNTTHFSTYGIAQMIETSDTGPGVVTGDYSHTLPFIMILIGTGLGIGMLIRKKSTT